MDNEQKKNTVIVLLVIAVLLSTMLTFMTMKLNRDLTKARDQAVADAAKQKAWRDFYQWRDGTALGHSMSPQKYPKYYELYPNDDFLAPDATTEVRVR